MACTKLILQVIMAPLGHARDIYAQPNVYVEPNLQDS